MCKRQEDKILGSKKGGNPPGEEQGYYGGSNREMCSHLQAALYTVNHKECSRELGR